MGEEVFCGKCGFFFRVSVGLVGYVILWYFVFSGGVSKGSDFGG